jgi:uncharacterized protein YggT (Ycf19 family)
VAEAFPIWVVIIDYLFGMVMYTLIGRFAMGLFLPEDSTFFFMRAFVKLTDPIIKLFKWITPSFLIQPFVPLYVAWFFFMFRARERTGARRRQPGRLLRRLGSGCEKCDMHFVANASRTHVRADFGRSIQRVVCDLFFMD